MMGRGKQVSRRSKRDRVQQFARKNGIAVDYENLQVQQDIKKPLTMQDLNEVEALNAVQKSIFESWSTGLDLALAGSAGTGKTYLACYLALRELLTDYSDIDTVYIVRSAVPVRDMGFLPGDLEEKQAAFELPYISIIKNLIKRPTAYKHMKEVGQLKFMTTSYIQGETLENCVVIADEFENFTLHELDALYTRLGKNARIIFSGDTVQNCLNKGQISGMTDFLNIVRGLDTLAVINLTGSDIVRSKKVKNYILRRDSLKV